jgi:myo-inositol catabolism protein IolS
MQAFTRKNQPEPSASIMNKLIRSLPATVPGHEASRLAMGCWALSGDTTWGEQPEKLSLATIGAALDVGINVFDTAEAYGDGRSEEVLGRGLAGRRAEAIVATKFNQNYTRATEVEQACERSLRRLKTDYIDIYQMHWPSRNLPYPELITAVDRLRASGKVRVFGVSNFGKSDIDEAGAAHCHPDLNQVPYSLLWRTVEYEVAPASIASGIGLLCYSPLMQGLLTGKFPSAGAVPEGRARTRLFSSLRPQARHREEGFELETFETVAALRAAASAYDVDLSQAAVAWLLAHPGVVGVVVGVRTPGQVSSAADAANLPVPVGLMDEFDQLSEPLKVKLGNTPDMWFSDSRYR